jgi:endonuclease/exonuclease/phosphatase family metal-dependent hydrolase
MFSLGSRVLSVMTWNIYQGADLAPIFAANPDIPGDLEKRVTNVFRQFLATNFQERAKAIARQIILEKPDIIGLQEAVLVELIPPKSPCVEYDFVDILLNELACRGMKYCVAARNQNSSAKLPSSLGNKIRFTDRDVILIRKGAVKVINKQESNFVNNLTISFNNKMFTILRGWSYIDAYFQGHMFRMVNTHLEPLHQGIQVAQGTELIDGPGKTDLPLIFIGDFNSKADGTGTATYGNLIAANFKDTWNASVYGDGFTAHQDADLLNAYSSLDERIDLILTRNINNWDVVKDILIGEDQADRTNTRLWPSDHAGIVAKFKYS